MKYVCEICGCTMQDINKMLEHEKVCREQNNSLIYCAEQINLMVGLASATPFGLVAELYGDDNKPVCYPIKGAEIEAARRRCKIELVYENNDKQAAQNQKVDKKTK